MYIYTISKFIKFIFATRFFSNDIISASNSRCIRSPGRELNSEEGHGNEGEQDQVLTKGGGRVMCSGSVHIR